MNARSRLGHGLRVANRALGKTTGFQLARVPRLLHTRNGSQLVHPWNGSQVEIPWDVDQESREIIEAVQAYTMTLPEEIYNFILAVRYVHDFELAGAIVECGVWRGGSMMAAAQALLQRGDDTRELHLFDTFDGMTFPEDVDVHLRGGGEPAAEFMERHPSTYQVTLTKVKETLATVPYPSSRIHYVKGPVEQTLPSHAPHEIAVLRLDTCWYSSTKRELETLYPRLVTGGVLIVDDYGGWQGAKDATDQFLCASDARILMLRTGPLGARVGVKM